MEAIIEGLNNIIEVNPWLAPVIALVSGILTSFMPCSLSTIPLIIGFVGGSETIDSEKPSKRAFMLSVLFALGSTIIFCIFGMLASVIGSLLEDAEIYLHIVMGIILILMALQMWSVIDIIPSSNSVLAKNRFKGGFGAFVSGVIAGLFSSHCALPIVITLMAVAVDAGNKGGFMGILLFAFSVGHAILSVIAGTSVGFVQKLMSAPKYEKTSKVIKCILGIVIFLTAFFLLGEAISEVLH